MDTRHIPQNLALLRQDFGSQVVTIRCRGGYPEDCLRFAGDQIGLVLEPTLIWTRNREDGQPADLRSVGLDRIVSIEFQRGSRQEVRWVRDPDGLWLRFADQGR